MFKHFYSDDDIDLALENVLKSEKLSSDLVTKFWRELNKIVSKTRKPNSNPPDLFYNHCVVAHKKILNICLELFIDALPEITLRQLIDDFIESIKKAVADKKAASIRDASILEMMKENRKKGVFFKLTKHPYSGKHEIADWISDYFGVNNCGVVFKDGTVVTPDKVVEK